MVHHSGAVSLGDLDHLVGDGNRRHVPLNHEGAIDALDLQMLLGEKLVELVLQGGHVCGDVNLVDLGLFGNVPQDDLRAAGLLAGQEQIVGAKQVEVGNFRLSDIDTLKGRDRIEHDALVEQELELMVIARGVTGNSRHSLNGRVGH